MGVELKASYVLDIVKIFRLAVQCNQRDTK